MKKIIVLFVLATLLPGWLNAQPVPGLIPPRMPVASQTEEPLRRFDLDFPGGTPGALVKAIEKANNHPLNAIIPTEFANTQMPPLRMSSVTVPELFNALSQSSSKVINVVSGTYFNGGAQPSRQYQQFSDFFSFATMANPVREDSVWYFHHNAPPPPLDAEPAKTCRFFQLEPYLETYKVEDITTAIETGWKMLGFGRGPSFTPDNTAPEISYHKDTKLLIAVGDPNKLNLIDSVLQQLPKTVKPGSDPFMQQLQRTMQTLQAAPKAPGTTNSGATDK